MGWICLTGSPCAVVDGVWNSQGQAIYSVSDLVFSMQDSIIRFLANITPVTYAFIAVLTILSTFMFLALGIQKRVRVLGK